MQSFSQNKKINLPNFRKKQAHKEEEADYFDLLFEDGYGLESALPENIRQKDGFFKGYHFYIVIGFALLIAACFLVVQLVTSGPEIEKYKTVAKNIEDIDTEKDVEEPIKIAENDSSVPDVQFAGNSVSKPEKPVPVKIKPIVKPNHVVVHKVARVSAPKKILAVKVVSKSVNLNKDLPRVESKVDQAIAEIMLRPLIVSDSNIQNRSGVGLRRLH